MEAGRELDALVAEKVMGLKLVGNCKAWDPEGSGYCIYRPDAGEPGALRPAYVAHCNCDIFPLYQDESEWTSKPLELFSLSDQRDSLVSREARRQSVARKMWKRVASDHRREFEADKAIWGHASGCLDVVPAYSTEIGATSEVWEVWRRENRLWRLLDNGKVFGIELSRPNQTFSVFAEDADTIPLATCLTALRAVA